MGLAAAEREDRFLDTSFTADGNNYKWQADLDLGKLERTVDQLTSTFDAALDRLTDSLSDTIEKQVDSSLPLWMRHSADRRNGEIEAISGDLGNLGDGIDDGLKVHFENGETEDLEGSRIPQPSGGSDLDDVEMNRPTFGSSFPFNPFLPFGGVFNRRPEFNLFDFSNRRQWWKGPNVCVDREETDEGKNEEEVEEKSNGNTFFFSIGHMEMTSCKDTGSVYTCTTKTSRRGIHKTVTVTHKCCHGYVKEASGCTKIDMRSLPDTLQDIGATDFLSLTKSAGMEKMLNQNLTIFSPTNEAMQEFTADLEAENEFDNGLDGDRSLNEVYHRRQRSINKHDMVLSHLTQGIHYASDLHDEQVLFSMADNSTLRINTYGTVPPVATVNCARLVTINQHSISGVVHTIDKVLKPVTKSLAGLISSDPQFTILKQLISNAGMLNKLREPGQLTVFAPTDAAFQTLSETLLESLLEGNACLDAVVKNHILPNVICSAAVQGKARTANLLESFLLLEKTEDEKMFVEDAQIVARDIIGTNGVMHIIDAPIMPQEAKPVKEVLENHNLTRFLELLESAGMTDELDTLTDVTVFAPSNKAIESIPEEVRAQIVEDTQQLRNILNYHLVTPSLQADDINNDHIASTRSELPLRINLYSRTPLLTGLFRNGGRRSVRMTAACSPVSTLDSRACGAVVHIVEKLFVVPKESVMHHLEANEDFSIFTELLKNTGMNNTLVEEGPFTVLAPSDHVFRALPKVELDQIKEDSELQELLVKQHILKEHVCCSGINPNTWLFMDHKRAMDGSAVHVRRTNSGRLMAGPARITHCSSPTQNGLVHTVNNLLINVSPRRDYDEARIQRPIFSAPGLQVLFG